MLRAANYIERVGVSWIGQKEYRVETNVAFRGYCENQLYHICETTRVTLGCGVGHGSGYIEFYFNVLGELILHGAFA